MASYLIAGILLAEALIPTPRPENTMPPVSPWCDAWNTIPRISREYPDAIICRNDVCTVLWDKLPVSIVNQIQACPEFRQKDS